MVKVWHGEEESAHFLQRVAQSKKGENHHWTKHSELTVTKSKNDTIEKFLLDSLVKFVKLEKLQKLAYSNLV